ncbi:SDR family NAD(P)-dependent oxidoreductase [Aureibacter tunicatorum]|uniref:Short-subunit dehydrogenase n=1 Tax=Aureibacter tunicatorum TaxID=866807 RepID=A0AAE3XQZ8_9BACT|nr:SDR family NAD(P)-dependent oxidoreductase [Aureibacter tunicatorum]MDR6239824.1 short-subunit dehydrogenase [Aureibacter tunicatorum]BDD04299.1 short-chain dehydrogenase [Aureibacter tunicatorum]
MKTVWVLGANSGLGIPFCEEIFKRWGECHLILSGRDLLKLEEVEEKLKKKFSRITLLPFDIEDFDQIDSALVKVNELGGVDMMIYCIGLGQRSNFLEMDWKVFNKLMHVNFTGVAYLLRKFLNIPLSQGRYVEMIFVNSIQAVLPIPNRTAYSASKGALRNFLNSLMLELKGKNIRICQVFPAYIDTDFSRKAMDRQGNKHDHKDSNQSKGMRPELVARKSLEALWSGKTELIISSFKYKIIAKFYSLFPNLFKKLFILIRG